MSEQASEVAKKTARVIYDLNGTRFRLIARWRWRRRLFVSFGAADLCANESPHLTEGRWYEAAIGPLVVWLTVPATTQRKCWGFVWPPYKGPPA